MFKRYVSIMASVLLAVTMLLPGSSSVALANTEVQQTNTSMQAATYTIDIEVEGLAGVILKEPIQITEGQNAIDALKKALDSKSIDYSITESEWGAYVSSINNEEAGSLGHWDGWMYSVNGKEPNVGASAYVLEQQDKLRFYYGRYASLSTSGSIQTGSDSSITVNLKGDTFTDHATNPTNWVSNQSNVEIISITKKSNQQIVIHFKGTLDQGFFQITPIDKVTVGGGANSLTVEVTEELTRTQDAIQKAAKQMMQGPIQSEWEAIGLTKAGFDIHADYEESFYSNFEDQILKKTGKGRLKITDVERIAMAAVAIGKDPKNVKQFDLIEKIYNSENWTYLDSDSMTYQGNNGPIFALIALDTKNYSVPENARWNREKIVAELLRTQLVDGSWSLANDPPGKTSYDITAMALIGLAPYTDQPAVKNAVEQAVNFLSKNQGATGGFNEEFVGGISSEATSQIIIGLTANNINPQSEMFTKNGINLIDHLLSFQAEDGGFKHTIGEKGSNGMATEQALQGLVAYDLFIKGEGRLYDFSKEISQTNPEIEQNTAILKGLLNGSLLNIQKSKDNIWSPIALENAQAKEGYFIVQAGENGTKKEVKVPNGTKKVFLVDNDRSYKDFDIAVVTPNKPWTITFNETVKDSVDNLSKIYVEDIQGSKVPVNVTANGNKVTVTPQSNYTSGQLYSLFIVEPVSDKDTTLKQATRKLFIIQ
ncbi:hypothetical protein CSV69_07125 [Sporosarcina sp. P26b]|uniref:DUF4430 domain-containing protein n=1 Tax=Sporosarcina sp. P26b TaxID=2048253 RepID=UPI000C172DEF|nr:DUF4430 domain-containing protein [Sporosarcina sp. P26b]PIC96244.1 hypothetical protein CSV69_07125 [Sporosarcina sp. P26b]